MADPTTHSTPDLVRHPNGMVLMSRYRGPREILVAWAALRLDVPEPILKRVDHIDLFRRREVRNVKMDRGDGRARVRKVEGWSGDCMVRIVMDSGAVIERARNA